MPHGLEVFVVQPATAPSRDSSFGHLFGALVANVERAIQGKREQIHLALVCLVAEGHLLIEDVPGVGKTSLAKAIARSIGGSCHRIQFTPDLLPSDVSGVSVWNRQSGEFEFRPGGVFANVVLADEINRASPKTQSALLEAMEERQVTVDARTYRLPRPFMVIATQNPIELEGTYPLPEAQLDRFLMRIPMGYPNREAELAILEAQGARTHTADELQPVVAAADVADASALVSSVHFAPELRSYVLDLVDTSRRHPDLILGVSPRGSLAVQRAARALAASHARSFVIPDDVKRVFPAVIEHRLLVAPDAQLRGITSGDVVDNMLASVPVPGTTGA
ncbi:MAG TPA: AAA family ATPase [Acidimicrobiia bacterium]|nr:AAA family ATPase [Acidimicrobiia bacterium]